MKLRIRGQSLRIRLTRTEVDSLRDIGHVEERVELAPVAFTYRLTRGVVLSARFDGAVLEIRAPEATVRDFCETDRVGFEGVCDGVRLLVEKDWQCLAPRDEDESDHFPHPKAPA